MGCRPLVAGTRRSLVAIAMISGLGAVTVAAAAPKRPSKPARRAGGMASNLPPGFTWPPSRAMLDAETRCEKALDVAGVPWHRASRDGHIVDAVILGASPNPGMLGGVAYTPVFGKGPYKLDCQLVLALVTIGPELAAAGVREVRFGSIYRWSKVRVNGVTKNALSRHALGLAMDVVSFVDQSGREARVDRDYAEGDPLLLEVERTIDASSSFRLVLTPKNDPISHKDHFHLEANPTYGRATASAAPARASRQARTPAR